MATLTYDEPDTPFDTSDVLFDGEPTPPILLLIGDQRLEDRLSDGWSVTDQVEERSKARLQLIDDDLSLNIERGTKVRLRVNSDLIFAGEVDTPTEQPTNPGTLVWDLTCVDWHVVTDRRTVSAAYVATTAGDIVKDLIATVLDDESITQGTIEDGAQVTEATFNYVPVTKAMDRLAEGAGFVWFIDPLKRLHFHRRETTAAPWTVDDAKDVYHPNVKNRNPEYRTREIVRGGTAQTDPQTESFVADGTQKTFVLGYPLAKEPTIEEDSVEQTVGVKGIGEEGARWLWSFGSNELTLAEEETPPTNGVDIDVSYIGMFDVVLVATDLAEQERISSLSGGSGIIEHVETDREINSLTAASERAGSLLNRYARPARELSFATDQPGLKPGQLLTVTLPLHRLSGDDLLISQVVTKHKGALLRYEVVALDGPVTGSWAKYFRKLIDRQQQSLQFRENISEQETLIVLEQFPESHGWAELTTEAVFACDVYPATTDAYDDAALTYDDPGPGATPEGRFYDGFVVEQLTYPATTDTFDDVALTYDDPGPGATPTGRSFDGFIDGGRPTTC